MSCFWSLATHAVDTKHSYILVPTQKMVRYLTSSPSAVKKMLRKAELMGIITQVGCPFFSSPEPKAHTYSIGRHPSSVCHHSSSVNTFKQHLLWSHEADSYQISYMGRGCVFCFSQIRTPVAMAAYSCHWLMGNLEISNFCCLTAEI